MLCRHFGDLTRVCLCYVIPLNIAVYVWCKALVNPCLAMLCRPFGELSRVWLCYVGPLVTLAVLGYIM